MSTLTSLVISGKRKIIKNVPTEMRLPSGSNVAPDQSDVRKVPAEFQQENNEGAGEMQSVRVRWRKFLRR